MPHSLDHLVLPTASLVAARARLRALGFMVAPDAKHPFGTANACVFLADGAYLEPLAIYDPTLVKEAAAGGNVFTAHDQVFRTRVGEEGLSALVFRTRDAAADHERFERLGISAGGMLTFSRTFTDADGRRGEASFRLAFARDLRAPDSLFFACERINAPPFGRVGFTSHANGAAGIDAVLMTAAEPEHFDTLLDHMGPANAMVEIQTPEQAIETGLPPPGDGTLRFAGIRFKVGDKQAVEELLHANGVAFDSRGKVIVVPPAPGQGVAFLFDEPAR